MFKALVLVILISYAAFAQSLNKINSPSPYIRLDFNNISLPINNFGTIGDINVGGIHGGRWGNKLFLYSSGFLIAGFKNDTLWANGQATASLIENFMPGQVNSNPADPKNVVYLVTKDDPDFGSSWIEYKDAVWGGADFYDGNGDGVYNPVDLNGNGKWDKSEDRPDYLGDFSAWCVFNDSKMPRQRYPNVKPVGIEIQETVFGYENPGSLGNIIYVRYRMYNAGTVADKLDNVYFSLWADPDIGDFTDDLVACDTLLDGGYCYNDGLDAVYGANAPAFMMSLVQGPLNYIPGVTFTDVNGNGTYEEGTDIAIDTAYSYRGPLKGRIIFPGAKNLGISSFVHYQQSDPNLGDPSNETEAYNYARGKNKIGQILDPCTWNLGKVKGGVDCSKVNPAFWYSGDPVTNMGWINIRPTDQRLMINTGPFTLSKNKPVEIITAYVVNNGINAIDAVTQVRTNTLLARNYFKNNFPYTSVKDANTTPNVFTLYQNYPNPFNPSTSIKFSIANAGNIKLTLFNSLGQEIKDLASGYYSAGEHEITLNASDLSSGVYFYRLTSTSGGVKSYSSTRKLSLLK